jgi:hypothetical protein
MGDLFFQGEAERLPVANEVSISEFGDVSSGHRWK